MKKVILSILQRILKYIAKGTVRRYAPVIVGITGSVGKTSTKEAIRTVIAADRSVRAPSKNFNNELGLPLAILGDWEKTGGAFFWISVVMKGISRLIIKDPTYPEVLVLEYAVDRPGDMKYLLEIARPHIGVFTAMGEVPVHIEYFAGPDAVAREKSRLVAQLPATGFAILNIDDQLVIKAKADTRAQVVTFGMGERADVRITNFTSHFDGRSGGISMKLIYGGSSVPVRIDRALGEAQAYSASIAAAVGLIFGMNLVTIAEALSHYEAPAGRLKLIQGIRESMIIDDTYNAAPASVENALHTLSALPAKRKIAILGDMLELGKYTLEAHEEVGKLVKKKGIDLLLCVGIRGKLIADAAVRAGMLQKNVISFSNLRDAQKYIQDKVQKGDLILIKGSQGVRMERVVKEIMAEPVRAKELLVRQNEEWEKKTGLYDEGE